MSLTMHIYSKRDESSEGWDVSEIVHDIEYTTSILGQAGKLTFTLEKDTSEDPLQISIGSLVKFWHSDKEIDIKKGEKGNPVFFGNVFKIGTDSSENYKVVAYDQTRYLQNHEYRTITFEDDKTFEDVFDEICSTYELKKKITYRKPNPSDYDVQKNIYIDGGNFIDVPAFEILTTCFAQATTNGTIKVNPDLFADYDGKRTKKPYFYVRDDFGTVGLHEILCDFLFDENGELRKEYLVIGDESLLGDYNYEVEIDSNTYNEFIFMYSKEKNSNSKETKSNKQVDEKENFIAIQAGTQIKNTNTSLDGQKIGDDTIPKWGKLNKILEVKKNSNKYKLADYAKVVIEYYNQPTRSLKLSAIGYDGIYAGNSFILSLKKLKQKYMPVYVISATHKYNGDVHTMDLEVNASPRMELFE